VPAQRLRGLRGSAADPLNLLQIMLAKGATVVAATGVRPARLKPARILIEL